MPEVLQSTVVRAIGAKAAAALRAADGHLSALAEFPDAPYMRAGGEIVWIGATGPMHPRAIFIDSPSDRPARLRELPAPWSAPRPKLTIRDSLAFRSFLRDLLPDLARAAPASGLGPLLAGRTPPFPLAARAEACRQAGIAAIASDAAMFVATARRLLGAGLGLTPSGDDFVGAALFTLRTLHPGDARWADAALQLADMARERTHSIGAALFSDLADGHSFAPLHDLFAATDIATFAECASAIAEIGHSSGSDMLAGIVAASIGLPPPIASTNAKDTP